MIPSVLAFSFQNVRDGGGISLALTGMAIVLSGLALIAVFIAVLPTSLRLWDRWRTPAKQGPILAARLSPEIQAALTWVAARELEVFQLGDRQKLTFRPSRQPSLWEAMPKLSHLPTRSVVND